MAAGRSFNDNQPIGELGRMPIYMSLLIVIVHSIAFFLALNPETGKFLEAFKPIETFQKGLWWQPLTYVLNEKGNFFGLISIFFIYWAGVEVEKFYGRWAILKLYSLLLLITPLASTLCWLFSFDGLHLERYGSSILSAGMIAAFATLYPRAEVTASLTLRTVTLIILALMLVVYARDHDGVGAFAFLSTCGVSSIFILRLRHGDEFSFARLFQNLRPQPQPRMRVLPDPPRRKVVTVPLSPKPEEADVDALLDKIAKSGLASLTATERRKLEAARQELLKKERR